MERLEVFWSWMPLHIEEVNRNGGLEFPRTNQCMVQLTKFLPTK